MSDFSARCVLYNIKSKTLKEKAISSKQDIFDIVGDGSKDSVSEVKIDKYHRLYYSKETLKDGVSGRVKVLSRYDEYIGTWMPCDDFEFIFGDEVLFVFCDDKIPIDITEESIKLIRECLTY